MSVRTPWKHEDDAVVDRPPYHYLGCGLDDVYLANGYEIHETAYGTGVRITNLDELHDEIGRYVVHNKKVLNAKEIRFLRHQMDVTQAELAHLMGYDSQSIARFEKGKTRLLGPADRMLRILFEDHLENRVSTRELLEALDRRDDQSSAGVVFEDINGRWEFSSAA